MVTIYKLNKLTTKQLSKLRETVEATKGNRRKVEAFAQAISKLATKQVDKPRTGSNIARIYTHNLGNTNHPDRRLAFITCGKFIEWGRNRETVVTTCNQRGIFAGKIINPTGAAMTQLRDEFSELIFIN